MTLLSILKGIRLVSFSPFQVLSLRGVSFVPLQVSSPFPLLSKPCNVSSCIYHYLLVCIATFVKLLVLVSIGINRHSDGEGIGSNTSINEGVKGFGNNQ